MGQACTHLPQAVQLCALSLIHIYLLLALVAAFMPCHAPPGVPDLYIGRVDLNFDSRAHRQRRRVEVGQHLYAAALVDLGKMQRGQIETFFNQRQQMLALGQHRRTDRLAAAGDDPVLFLKRTGLQKPVQSLQIVRLRYGNKIVAPELAALALDTTLG